MREISLTYLNRNDVERAALADEEILGAIEASLAMQGRGETVIEPRVHLEPKSAVGGHFNVLRGWVGGEIDLAGVKIVGDFAGNYAKDLPSELGLLCLFDPGTGAPAAVLDASGLTEMRTGAVTAVGARYLARTQSRTLGHIGTRGTAYWNVRLLDRLFDFETIRVHSRRPESRTGFAERLSRELGKEVVATADWRSCAEGADIVVEASRLSAPEPLLRTEWIKPGALVIPYGTMSAVELSLTDVMSKIVVDDWGQCRAGKLGALRAHVEAGKLSEETLHAELGEIVAGLRPGREDDSETILFWHRGLSLSDIALGHAILRKAAATCTGQALRYT
jgi:alanine dehydrogenase